MVPNKYFVRATTLCDFLFPGILGIFQISDDFVKGIKHDGHQHSPALRVPRADTRLTVYRPSSVRTVIFRDPTLWAFANRARPPAVSYSLEDFQTAALRIFETPKT